MQSSSGDDIEDQYDSSSRANPSFLLPLPFSSTHPHHPRSSSNAAAAAAETFFNDPNPLPNTYGLSFTNTPINPQLPCLPSSHHQNDDLILDQNPSPPASSAGLGVVAKNPKKRTRASRRAPTTVLTTDTSNFRAMVQEFTGIPSPPFSTGRSCSLGRRLEIFRSPASFGHHLDSLYNPFRESVHKVQTFIPSSSSSTSSSVLNHHITVDATNVASSMDIPTTNRANYHAFTDLPHPKLPLSSQTNQVPTFQPLLSLDDEFNATNLGGMNCGDHVNRDEHGHQELIIRQFDVPPLTSPEFDRREKDMEI